MNLSGFKIKNFRSIVDSGWSNLSSDNITALIGQNESGKTSVLEALYSFHKGTISEDVLRSDLSIPEVSCSFTFMEDESLDFIDTFGLPAEIISEIKKSRKIVLTRKWFPDMTNQLVLTGDNITGVFDYIEEKERSLKEKRIEKIKEKKSEEVKLFKSKGKYIWFRLQVELLRQKKAKIISLIKKLMGDKDLYDSEKESGEEVELQKPLLSRQEAGEAFFGYIPRFEFFEDFSSLLPNRIELEHIFEKNNRVEGYKAVRNFLIIAGLDPEFFKQTNKRILKQKIENLNNEVTIDFQEYWRQSVGKTNKITINFELEHYDISHPEKKGKPYLEFWIKDQHERLYPKQRSRGVRWFLSFYLELKAYARENSSSQRILLIDEPGLSLHARAQEDVLKVFENIKRKIQIIYTTHSPHLIDHNKFYRLLAVQRTDQNSEQSETIIFDASHLHSASSDTLSPVCTLMGTSLTRQQIVKQSNNIIVEDICSFYYLSALCKLTANLPDIYFLPANGPAEVTTLVNLLIGWGFDFSVLLFDNEDNHSIINELNSNLTGFEEEGNSSRLILTENICAPEDLFSTIDFKKYIIKKRGGISGQNSAFINHNEISRPLLAATFAESVVAGNFSFSDFDEETRQNLKDLFESMSKKIMISDET